MSVQEEKDDQESDNEAEESIAHVCCSLQNLSEQTGTPKEKKFKPKKGNIKKLVAKPLSKEELTIDTAKAARTHNRSCITLHLEVYSNSLAHPSKQE